MDNSGMPAKFSSSPRRIVVMHLIHTMEYGGIETAVINWLKRIDRERFDIHLVCFANSGNTEAPFLDACSRNGIKVQKIPWSRGKPFLRAALCLKKLLEEYRVDILHTHNCYADIVGCITRLFYNVKLVTTVYVWARFDFKRNALQFINRQVIRFFDIVGAHCEDTYRKTATFIPRHKLRLLICGFEFTPILMSDEEIAAKRAELGISRENIVLANIARFYPEKAQADLLRSFREIVSVEPHVRLWMFGVGPLEDELRKLCCDLQLDDHVTFMGFVGNLFEFLPLVDIQVHPSHMEGVSLAICSGMAAGLPIVASDVGGLHEVIKNNRTGILVPENDNDEFVTQVLRLIKNRDERERLGAAARRFMENDYSLEKAVRDVESVYREVMS